MQRRWSAIENSTEGFLDWVREKREIRAQQTSNRATDNNRLSQSLHNTEQGRRRAGDHENSTTLTSQSERPSKTTRSVEIRKMNPIITIADNDEGNKKYQRNDADLGLEKKADEHIEKDSFIGDSRSVSNHDQVDNRECSTINENAPSIEHELTDIMIQDTAGIGQGNKDSPASSKILGMKGVLSEKMQGIDKYTVDETRGVLVPTTCARENLLLNSFDQQYADEPPCLIPSNTEESDDMDDVQLEDKKERMEDETWGNEKDLREILSDDILCCSGPEENKQREAVAFLLRYETMDLQQEAEETATIAYMRPMLERLQTLGKEVMASETNGRTSSSQFVAQSNVGTTNEGTFLDLCSKTFTHTELKKVLKTLEVESNSSRPNEFVVRDRQLMMVLHLIIQKHAKSREDALISWAEIIHCYRVCVIGMMTLKNMPKSSAIRSRTKQRIMSQLSLFGRFTANSDNLMNDNNVVSRKSFEIVTESTLAGNIDHFINKTVKKKRSNLPIMIVTVAAAMLIGFTFGRSWLPSESIPALIIPPKSKLEIGSSVNSFHPYSFAIAKLSSEEQTFELENNDTEVDEQDEGDICPLDPDLFLNDRSSRISEFGFVRKRLSAEIPRSQKFSGDLQRLSTVALLHLAESLTKESASSEEDEGSSATLSSMERAEATHPTQQMLFSAAVGAAGGIGGVLGSPRVLALSKSAARVLALNNLGVVSASLVIVGAIAVVANVVKGIRFFLQQPRGRND